MRRKNISCESFLRIRRFARIFTKPAPAARIWAALFAVLLAAPGLCGCAFKPKKNEMLFFAMDTYMELTAYGKGSEEGVREAYSYIIEMDSLLTNKESDSDISALNRAAGQGEVPVSPKTAQVLDASLLYCAQSGGLFDITIAPLTALWDVRPSRASLPDPSEIKRARALVDYTGLVRTRENTYRLTSPGMAIDLGAIAKGFVSDRAAGMLRQNGVGSGLISLGGNIFALGGRPDGEPWSIGLRDPNGTENDYFGIVKVRDKAVVTSGDYERYFMLDGVRYHHILDPRTGNVARSGLRSVTVVADSGALADAFSTALFVMGLEDGLDFQRRHGGFEAVFVTEDNRVVATEGIKDAFLFRGKEKGYLYED